MNPQLDALSGAINEVIHAISHLARQASPTTAARAGLRLEAATAWLDVLGSSTPESPAMEEMMPPLPDPIPLLTHTDACNIKAALLEAGGQAGSCMSLTEVARDLIAAFAAVDAATEADTAQAA